MDSKIEIILPITGEDNMAIISINEAAQQWCVKHSILYQKIKNGHLTLSVRPDGTHGINTSEMVKEFGEPPKKNQPKISTKNLTSYSKNTSKKLIFIAWLQIVGSLIFIFNMLTAFYLHNIQGETLILLIITIALFLLSILAGYNLLKRNKLGYILTLINQLFQVIGFNIAGFMFRYSALGGIFLYLSLSKAFDSYEFAIKAYFNPGFLFVIQQNWMELSISIDFIAIIIIQILFTQRKKIAQSSSGVFGSNPHGSS